MILIIRVHRYGGTFTLPLILEDVETAVRSEVPLINQPLVRCGRYVI